MLKTSIESVIIQKEADLKYFREESNRKIRHKEMEIGYLLTHKMQRYDKYILLAWTKFKFWVFYSNFIKFLKLKYKY